MDQEPDDNPYTSPSFESVPDRPKLSLGAAARRGAKIGALSGLALVIGACLVLGILILISAIAAERRVEGGFWLAIQRGFEDRTVFEVIGRITAACAVFAAWGAGIGAVLSTLLAWSRRRSTPRDY